MSKTLILLASASFFLASCGSAPAIVASAVAQTAVNAAIAEHASDNSDNATPTTRAKTRTDLASGYFEQRQFKIAIEELTTALASDPKYVPAWNLLGLTYAEIGDNIAADSAFKKGLAISDTDSDLLHNYASYLCFNKRESEAVPYFIKATNDRFYQESSKSYAWAGVCSLRIGDTEKAEEYLKKSIRLTPQNPLSFFWLAETAMKRKDFERAQSYLQEHFKFSEANSANLWLGIRIARARNDKTTMEALSSQLLKRFPHSEEAENLEKRRF